MKPLSTEELNKVAQAVNDRTFNFNLVDVLRRVICELRAWRSGKIQSLESVELNPQALDGVSVK